MREICCQTILFAAAALILMLGGCREDGSLLKKAEPNGSRIPPDTLISISESETLGQWFTLVIYADGKAVYTPTQFNGYNRENIPPQGVPVESRISGDQLEEIISEFEKQKFFSLDDSYHKGNGDCRSGGLDAGVKTVAIEIGEKRKTVRWDGCKKNGKDFPPEFFAVFDKIASVEKEKR